MHYRRTAGIAALMLLTAIAAVAGAATIRDPQGRAYALPLAEVAPANDNFADRQQLTPPFSPPGAESLPADRVQSTAGATLEAGENAACGNIGATVWFEFQAERDLTVEIDTTGSDFDTVLAVYTLANFVPSPPAGASLTPVACDDNRAAAQSRVVVPMSAYATYLVQAGGAGGATGMLHLHAGCQPACTPRNDNVNQATNIDTYSMPFQETRSTSAATTEAGEPRGCGNAGATVWYHVFLSGTVTLEASTAGSSFDTVLAVYRQDGFLPSPPGGLSQVACDDNGAGARPQLTFAAEGGTSYYIQAGGANGATGELTFAVQCIPACPPANDAYGLGYGLGFPTIDSVRTEGATVEAGEPLPCGGIGKTVWYQMYPNAAHQRIAIDTSGSSFDTVVAVYRVGADATLASLTPLTCTDHASSAPVKMGIDSSSQYAVQIGGHDGASGSLEVSVDCDPSPCPPYNDDLANAEPLFAPYALPGAFGADTRGATTQTGEPLECGGMGKTSWYALSGYTRGTLSFDARGSDFAAALAVYTGPPGATDFAGFTRVGCAAGTADANARIEWELAPGQTYYLQVGGVDGAGGQLNLFGDCTGLCPPPNDDAANAAYVNGGTISSARTTGATLEAGEPEPCGAISSSVWYQMGVPAGQVTLSTEGSDYASNIAVYVVEGASPPPGSLANIACSSDEGGHAAVTFTAESFRAYYVQVGATGGGGGNLQLSVQCDRCTQMGGGQAVGPGNPGSYDAIAPPNTGSGGYLPGARR